MNSSLFTPLDSLCQSRAGGQVIAWLRKREKYVSAFYTVYCCRTDTDRSIEKRIIIMYTAVKCVCVSVCVYAGVCS